MISCNAYRKRAHANHLHHYIYSIPPTLNENTLLRNHGVCPVRFQIADYRAGGITRRAHRVEVALVFLQIQDLLRGKLALEHAFLHLAPDPFQVEEFARAGFAGEHREAIV